MTAILLFVVFVLIADTVGVGIAMIVERFSESASLIVFFALFFSIFWAAWKAAVYVTERYFIKAH